MLSPVVLHRPYGGSGSSCQPATFATAVPTDSWLELEVATCADTYVPKPPYRLRVPDVLCAIRTRSPGQLASGGAALYVRRTRTSRGRAVRTAYRGTTQVAAADELCGLVFACPDQEQLGRLCTNASLHVTAMTTKRVKGRAVLVDMRADWRPW